MCFYLHCLAVSEQFLDPIKFVLFVLLQPLLRIFFKPLMGIRNPLRILALQLLLKLCRYADTLCSQEHFLTVFIVLPNLTGQEVLDFQIGLSSGSRETSPYIFS